MAQKAAAAALAAESQGKFWEFHDHLFKNPSQISENRIQEIATELQLDMPKFQAEMEEYIAAVAERYPLTDQVEEITEEADGEDDLVDEQETA